MAELKLKPELIPMVIEGGFYLAALASSYFLLVKPLLALTTERRRRTQGTVESAKGLESKLEKLQKTYHDAHQAAHVEVRDLLNNQILAGQAEASGIIQEAHEVAKTRLADVRNKMSEQVAQERAKIPGIVRELTDTVLNKLVKASLLFTTSAALCADVAVAGDGAVDPIYGILWPYFQFIVFAAALTFLARKAVSKMLDERRDALKTKLSEAREAMTLAQRRSEEYEAKIKNLQNELDALRKEYADEGVRQRDKLIHDAKESAAQLMRDTERVGRQLIAEGKDQLRKEIYEQVVSTLESKLKGDVLKGIDASLRQSALTGLQNITTTTATY